MTHRPSNQGPKRSASRPQIRRRALLILGGASAATFVAACGGGGEETGAEQPAPGVFGVGNVSDFPEGSVTVIAEGGFLILHDAAGLYAMSAVCTHQGCTVDVAQQTLPCPCHGSVFDFDGDVVTGPANVPLDHLQLSVEPDGTVVVDSSVTVAASSRAQP